VDKALFLINFYNSR